MRRGQARPRRSGGAVRSRRSRRTTTVTLCTVGARTASIDNERCRSSPSSQILGVSTRCTAMYWNGRRIVQTITTMEHRPTGRLGFPEIAVAVPFAAVPGTSLRISLALPSECGSTPSIGPALRAFGSGGRLPLESHSNDLANDESRTNQLEVSMKRAAFIILTLFVTWCPALGAKTLDLDSATIADINAAFKAGTLTAESLVQMCLARIRSYDREGPSLHAVITLNPKAIEIGRASCRDSGLM